MTDNRRVVEQQQRVKALNERVDKLRERIDVLQTRIPSVMNSLRRLNQENNFSTKLEALYRGTDRT